MKIAFLEKLNIRHFINKCYRFDKKKFVKYSRAVRTRGNDHILAQIALKTHIIEKGLTMPDMRPGFGQEAMLNLISLCKSLDISIPKSNPILMQAIQTILEYDRVHDNLHYSFDQSFRSELDSFVAENQEINASIQPVFHGAQQYFSDNEKPFPVFAHSRHTLRNFCKADIPIELLLKAVDLAQTAPSSCNRQSTRVHIITDKKDIKNILTLQNGNRGFGHLINKLLIITYFIPIYGSVKERHLGCIDSGIFTMNLLYALHYHKIGACTLNWCDSPKEDKRLRTMVQLEENETVSLFIACGMVPELPFKVARSQKLEAKIITTVH